LSSDDLLCTITTPPTDPDGDTIIYSYAWYMDDVLQPGLTTDTVPSASTARGEVWSCIVTPNDGTADGPTAQDQVTIGNAPPSVAGVSITPAPAYTSTDLTATPTGWSDPDGDAEGYQWQWQKYVSGSWQNISGATTSTLDSANFAKGDQIKVVCTPFDGTNTGDPVEDNITISNSPPTAPVVAITPDAPLSSDDLLSTITTPAADPDSDSLTYSYAWYMDDVLQAGLTTDTVPSASTSKEEVWRSVVTPNDNTIDGTLGTDELTIQNSPPVADAGLDQSALTNTIVTLNGSGSSDADGDPLACLWTQTGGTSVALSDSTANPTFTPTVADTYTFSLVVNDGTDVSLSSTVSVTVEAPNRAPVLSDGTVSPVSGRTATIFTYSVVYADDDNDTPISVTISIDGGIPQDMSVKPGEDGDYSSGEIYEYIAAGSDIGLGSHTFQFAADDSTDNATGDNGVQFGPAISRSGGGGGGGGSGGGGGVDKAAPVITDVRLGGTEATQTTAQICWTTDEPSTSQIEYWPESASSQVTLLSEELSLEHCVLLTDLKTATAYLYRAVSRDELGNMATSDESTFTTLDASPTFSTGALSISPTEANIGEEITVSVLSTNTGGLAGIHRLTNKMDCEVVATGQISLAPGASENITFTISRHAAGTYSVDVSGLSGTVVVKAASVVAAPLPLSPALASPLPQATPPARGAQNWLIIGGIIAGGATIGGILGHLIVRRKCGVPEPP
jgi:hypothetical protein